MPEPLETLVFVARLTRDEKDAIFERASAFPGTDITNRLLAAVTEASVDRLAQAEGCLEMARLLAAMTPGTAGTSEHLRAAVGRAYYSAHHSVRAMALWWNKWDPDGHELSIQELKALLQDNSFAGRSGLSPDSWQQLASARMNRHVADYSPYKVQRIPPAVRPVETITQDDWQKAAEFNIQLAEELFAAALKVVGEGG